MDYLIEHNTALNELQFILVSKLCKNEIACIYKKLITSGLDDVSLGFWILDIKNNTEIYSPQFRATLQFEGKHDFPDNPESWQKAIEPDSLKVALDNYTKHLESLGKIPYIQKVKYNRKINGKIDLLCHGKIIAWDKTEPLIMIGVHLKPDGSYKDKIA